VATTKNRADKAAVEPIVPAKRPLGESTFQGPAAAAEDEAPDVPAPKAKSKESLKKINSIFAAKPSSSGKSADNAAAPVVEQDEEQPAEKKKKRKLGGLGGKPAFVWDQAQVGEIIPAHRHCKKKKLTKRCATAQNPDGPIPSYLSPMKKSSTGSIPRAGFGAGSKKLFPRL
jgi:hypothetical protein